MCNFKEIPQNENWLNISIINSTVYTRSCQKIAYNELEQLIDQFPASANLVFLRLVGGDDAWVASPGADEVIPQQQWTQHKHAAEPQANAVVDVHDPSHVEPELKATIGSPLEQ